MTEGKITLKVDKREQLGKKSKKLRDQGKVLGNVVIPGKPSLPISVEIGKLRKIYDEAGESTLVYLTVGDEKSERPVLFKDMEFYPLRHVPFHVVFMQVNLKEKVEAAVPIEYVGEFKVDGGVLLKLRDSVDVSALPTDLPENFVIDLASLKEVDQSISLADLAIDKSKVEFVLSEDTNPEDVLLVQVQEEREEEPEEEVVADDVAATPAESQAKEEKSE